MLGLERSRHRRPSRDALDIRQEPQQQLPVTIAPRTLYIAVAVTNGLGSDQQLGPDIGERDGRGFEDAVLEVDHDILDHEQMERAKHRPDRKAAVGFTVMTTAGYRRTS
jgi:hypothetical protein